MHHEISPLRCSQEPGAALRHLGLYIGKKGRASRIRERHNRRQVDVAGYAGNDTILSSLAETVGDTMS
jgi:hypothetical protein